MRRHSVAKAARLKTMTLVSRVTEFFLASGDFNGITLAQLLSEGFTVEQIRAAVGAGEIELAFYSHCSNPHIRRLPCLPVVKQLELQTTEPVGHTNAYPTAATVRDSVDINQWNDKPYAKAMYLGAAELDWVGFEPSVLDRYVRDPRYTVSFTDYSGSISISDEYYESGEMQERDRVILQTFGLGYIVREGSKDKKRVVLVFYRYLAQLSPEHQQYWRTFESASKPKILDQYYKNSIVGDFADRTSFFSGIFAELKVIDEITQHVYGATLFRDTNEPERLGALSIFFLPTLRNYNEFILELDKTLSDNLNKKFFKDEQLEEETLRSDGKVVVTQKGTLRLLEEWLKKNIRWTDPNAVEEIMASLKQVRKERQAPAHKTTEDQYDPEYDEKQGRILESVYLSLMHIRRTLQKHPKAPAIELSPYIAEGRLSYF